MVPNDELKQETDGDPATVLEDTKGHERTGFRVNDDANVGSSMDNDTSPLVQNMKQYNKKES
ncbi:hypothetical protein MO973_14570 [Paenibacillus sp. TRM 82003]|nr:hypothetical protein [Paenibacillus sp. TRM 82003]